MAHKVCHDVGSWASSTIQQPLDHCINKNATGWCLCGISGSCFIVWVIVTIVTWVVTTVCEIVADVIDLVVSLVKGIIDLLAALFTWDGQRAIGGVIEFFGGIGEFIGNVVPIVTGGTLVGSFS